MYYILKSLSIVVCLLSQNVRNKIGDMIGFIFWPAVSSKRRNMAVNNAMIALGISWQEAQNLVRQSFFRLSRMFIEVLFFPKLNKKNIKKHVKIVGRHYIEEALAYGRGAILATAHTGNWEMLGAALALYDFPIVGIAQKQSDPSFDRFINEYRTMSGMHIAYKSSVREMIRLLGEGKIIGLIMDQDAKEHGVFVDFFGQKASTFSGAAALARLKDSPIIPAFITADNGGNHIVIVHPLVWVIKTSNRDQDIRVTTQTLSFLIEQHIRIHSNEWLWLHNRWKTRPSGD